MEIKSSMRVLIICTLIVVGGCATGQDGRSPATGADGAATEKHTGKSEALVAAAEPIMRNFLTAKHWEAVRNLTGVARAVFVAPSGGQVGLIAGGQWGRGILLVRHGQQWSDPVFIKLGALQIGLLAGFQRVDAAGAILSQAALERVLAGKSRVSGSGDATIGVGVSGKVAGSASGIELLLASTNKGVYLGGAFEGLRISLDEHLNRMAYGNDFDLEKIIKTEGGAYPPADRIRAMLETAAHEAVWGND